MHIEVESRNRLGDSPASYTCANCHKEYYSVPLKCCSSCGLRYYCDVVCQKAHWKDHKDDCLREQEAIKVIRVSSDPHHPFEQAIAATEVAPPLTAASFLDFFQGIISTFIHDADTTYIEGVDGVTHGGYVRLLSIAVSALKQHSHNIDVTRCALRVFNSYWSRYSFIVSCDFFNEELFSSGALESTVRCLQIHAAHPLVTCEAWFLLTTLSLNERSKSIAAITSVNLVNLASETMKLHRTHEQIVFYVTSALKNWLSNVKTKKSNLAHIDFEEFILVVLLTMRRFPSVEGIQDKCCALLRLIIEVHSECDYQFGTSREARIIASLTSKGVYEVLVDAVERFPTTLNILMSSAMVLKWITGMYFSSSPSRPRNTGACLALVSCLPHHLARSHSVITSSLISVITVIARHSPTSWTHAVHQGRAFRVLKLVLQQNMGKAACVADCCFLVFSLNLPPLLWDRANVESNAELLEIMHVLLQAFRQYLANGNGDLVENLMTALVTVSMMTHAPLEPNDDVIVLFEEAMRRHSNLDDLQTIGHVYLNMCLKGTSA